MCQVLKVSRSGYYDFLKRKLSARVLENQLLKKDIQWIFRENKGRYGSPKITEVLRDRGWNASRPRVARIMRSEGLRSITCKKFRVTTTDTNHDLPVAENHLNRKFKAEIPGQKWVSDITYIPTGQRWMYLTVIMDLYDRKIIGWAMSTTLTCKQTIMAAWRMALINRPIYQPLIFHSDRGVQYASHLFTRELRKHQVIQSMSRKGNCWDNAVAENFFKILKSESVKHSVYNNMFQAKTEMFEFIEIWYNRKRKHASLGYKTPEQYGNFNYSNVA